MPQTLALGYTVENYSWFLALTPMHKRGLILSLFNSIVLKDFFPLPIINLSCVAALCGDEGHGMVLLMCEYISAKTAGQSMKKTLSP